MQGSTLRASSHVVSLSLVLALSACGSPSDPPVDLSTPARVEITPAGDTLVYGGQVVLDADVFNESGAPLPNAVVQWSSSAPNVAEPAAGGVIHGRGVGSATITAKAGDATASVVVVVEPAEVVLAAAAAEVPPMRTTVLTVPNGAPSLSGESVSGTLGSQAIQLSVTGTRELTFFAPSLAPGSYEGVVHLDANARGTFSLTILPPASSQPPQEVADSLAASIGEVLEGLEEIPGDGGEAEQIARDALARFQAGWASLSVEDRAAVAGVIAANPEAFRFSADEDVAAGTDGLTRDRYTPAHLDRMAHAIRELAERGEVQRKLAEACVKIEFGPAKCRTLIEGMVPVQVLEIRDREWSLIDWIKGKIRAKVSKDPNGKLLPYFKARAACMCVRGAPPAADAIAASTTIDLPGTIEEGEAYILDLTAIMRTPTAEDAASGRLAPLGQAVSQFATARSAFASFMQSMLEIVSGLPGSAPTFLVPSQEGAEIAAPSELGLDTFEHPDVTCSGRERTEGFVFSCKTTSPDEQRIELPVVRTTPWETLTYPIEVVVRPVHVLQAVSGGNQMGVPEQPLDEPLVVRVVDFEGNPVVGIPLTWTVASGGGSLGSAEAVTDGQGMARASWTLGPTGTQRVTVEATESWGEPVDESPVSFEAKLEGVVGTWRLLSIDGQAIPTEWDGYTVHSGTLVLTEEGAFENSFSLSNDTGSRAYSEAGTWREEGAGWTWTVPDEESGSFSLAGGRLLWFWSGSTFSYERVSP